MNQIHAIESYDDHVGTGYALAATPARHPLERRQWDEAAGLRVLSQDAFPWDKYPEFETITYFARGLGAARTGNIEAAQEAIDMLDELYERTLDKKQDYWAVHVDVQRKAVTAWTAFAEGKTDEAVELMRTAADLEDSVEKHPVTPDAVVPARELLGDMLLELEKPEEALAAYAASLEISPNRFNSLSGDNEAATVYYTRLVELGKSADGERADLETARTVVVGNK